MKLKSPRSLFAEFRNFAFKGNMLDLAVGIVLGTAFGKVINSIVSNVIMPTVSYLIPTEGGYQDWKLGKVEVGTFLGELVNFIVIAAAIFVVVVKIIRPLMTAHPLPAAPSTKQCPMCCSAVPIQARRCPQCTSDLPA